MKIGNVDVSCGEEKREKKMEICDVNISCAEEKREKKMEICDVDISCGEEKRENIGERMEIGDGDGSCEEMLTADVKLGAQEDFLHFIEQLIFT